MNIWIALALVISIFAMFYGARRMGDKPEWNVVSGFVAFIAGLAAFLVTLFIWLVW